jgi:archaellum component FlaF (FlaF/FlaG flagellin family)
MSINVNIENYNITKIIINIALIAFLVFVGFVYLEITYINKEIQAIKSYREILIDHRLARIEEVIGLIE